MILAVSRVMEYHRNYPLSRHGTSPPPPAKVHMDEDNGNVNQRRRVSVACARCRKRKIRCSGDPGDNSGCQNCRSAGADIRECRFARVGSAELTLVDKRHNHGDHFSPPSFSSSFPPSPDPGMSWVNHSRGVTGSHFGSGVVRGSQVGALAPLPYQNASLDPYNFPSGNSVPESDVVTEPYSLNDQRRQFQGIVEPRPILPAKYYGGSTQHLMLGSSQPTTNGISQRRVRVPSVESLSPHNMSSLSLYPPERQLPPPTANSLNSIPPLPVNDIGRAREIHNFEGVRQDMAATYPAYGSTWSDPARTVTTAGRSQTPSRASFSSKQLAHRASHDSVLLEYSIEGGNTDLSRAGLPASSMPIPAHQAIPPPQCFPVHSTDAGISRSNSSTDMYAVTDSENTSSRTSLELPGAGDRYSSAMMGSQHLVPKARSGADSVARPDRPRRASVKVSSPHSSSGPYPGASTTSSF